jgi:hypothetical protein
MSKGKKIVVEIQRMITTQTHDESVRSFREFFRLDKYPQATVIQKTCEGLDTSGGHGAATRRTTAASRGRRTSGSSSSATAT